MRAWTTLMALLAASPALAWEFEGGWTPLTEVVPQTVNGSNGVWAQYYDIASDSYLDMTNYGTQAWGRPGIPHVTSTGTRIDAHPWRSGHSVLRVTLNGRDPSIRVRGSAGGRLQSGGGRNGFVFRIYLGEDGVSAPLWERDFTIVDGQDITQTDTFDLDIPYEQGDELFFVVDAKGQDGTDWANWYGVELFQTPATDVTLDVRDQNNAPIAGSQVRLDPDEDGIFEWFDNGDVVALYPGEHDLRLRPGIVSTPQPTDDDDLGLWRDETWTQTDQTTLALVWPTRSAIVDVTAGGTHLSASALDFSAYGLGRLNVPIPIVLPVTDNASGSWSTDQGGYDVRVLPGLGGSQPATALLWREAGAPGTTPSLALPAGGSPYRTDIPWPAYPCSWSLVDAAGQYQSAYAVDVAGLDLDRWPATSGLATEAQGDLAAGYPVSVDGNAHGRVHLTADGAPSPATLTVDGESLTLTCRAFAPPTCSDVDLAGYVGSALSADLMAEDTDGDDFSYTTPDGGSVTDGQFTVVPAEPGEQSYSVVVTDSTGQTGACTVTVTATIAPGLTGLPDGPLVTDELGSAVVLPIALTAQPTADVTVSLYIDDASEAQVRPNTLVFTPSGWNTAQTTVLEGLDDDQVDGDIDYLLSIELSSEDGGYDALPAEDIPAINYDDDAPGIVLSPLSGLVLGEDGTRDAFSVWLLSEPTGPVTLSFAVDDATEVAEPAALTIEPADWATGATVELQGVDDNAVDGDRPFEITVTDVLSDDPDYNDFAVDAVVQGVNRDDDELMPGPASWYVQGGCSCDSNGSAPWLLTPLLALLLRRRRGGSNGARSSC